MAPRSKLGKLLTCFYCGRRSTTRFDGKITSFDCSKCDATNFLDAAGDITDPPVTTTATHGAPNYARRSPSPSYRPAPHIFCRKCTTNQHLVVSSLAQYLPDDPDDPEYAARERNYYRFRRNLDKRYPQCCSDCEPKVRVQLDKANYTAKTDWLRRQLDYSSQTRILLTRTTANYVASAGKYTWFASLGLQLLWHLMLMQKAIITSDELDNKSPFKLAARFAGFLNTRFTAPESVIYWSFWLTLLSCWWNPRWVESWRGFVRHLHGFQNFYIYQAMILALKFPGYLNVSLLDTPRAQRASVQGIAQGSMFLLMAFLYKLAWRSIRTDNRKLWLPRPGSILATPPTTTQPSNTPPEPAEPGEKTMADVLDDILNEPISKPALGTPPYTPKASPVNKFDYTPTIGTGRSYDEGQTSQFDLGAPPSRHAMAKSSIDELDHMPPTSRRFSYSPSNEPLPKPVLSPSLGLNPFKDIGSPTPRPGTSGSNMGFGRLSLSDQPPTRVQTRAQTRAQQSLQQLPSYEEEMVWEPTQSQHRAFATYRPGQVTEKRGFNETPTTDNPNKVFWAKIPPKPTTPAQRIFNPPGQPIIRPGPATSSQQVPTTNPLNFKGSGNSNGGRMMFSKHEPEHARSASTVFAQPTFLPPPPRDERDSLAEIFKGSFSLSDRSDERRGEAGTHGQSGPTPAMKVKYMLLGLCLALAGNVVYWYYLSR